MSLEDKLESLDMVILAQYEKASQFAYKRLGMDKYDLSKISNAVAHGSMVGANTYGFIKEYFRRDGMGMALSAINVCLGAYFYHFHSANINNDQSVEWRRLEAGKVYSPAPWSYRPVLFASLLTVAALSTSFMFQTAGAVPEGIATEQFERLSTLGRILVPPLPVGIACLIYFRNCTPMPPTKSLWQKAKEYLAKPFHHKQLEPVLEQAKYVESGTI